MKTGTASVLAARRRWRPGTGTFVMAVIVPVLGFYLVWPAVWVVLQTFNAAVHPFQGMEWSLIHWRTAWDDPRLLRAFFNTFWLWFLVAAITFPVSILIAWLLARTRVPWAYPLEFLFWIGYMIPGGTIAWILLLEPSGGFINVALRQLPFIDTIRGPLNIYSIQGIVWANLMSGGVALKVMILTPAFRNMDMALEEAARVSGASTLRTMLTVTIPVMAPPIVLIFALQVLRIFSGFETEWLLGRPIQFFVYSTLIFEYIGVTTPPRYGDGAVLGTITLLVIALIVPLQRWIVIRRQYTTVSSGFKPGLIDLGAWKWLVFGGVIGLHFFYTGIQVMAFLLGAFMTRAGFFMIDPLFTLDHWTWVYSQTAFWVGLRTTLALAFAAGVLSPLLFSLLAYILVRTRWPGRALLDWSIWLSAAIPGILSGLGLLMVFLGTPGLSWLYGTIWALLLVVIIGGKTTGVNLSKGAIIQIGFDMEEAARISGAGWWRTYMRIWIPLTMPLLILLGTLNFVSAAGATSSVILLASRETTTLSILALVWASSEVGQLQAATIVNLHIAILTLGVAALARKLGLNIGLRHR